MTNFESATPRKILYFNFRLLSIFTNLAATDRHGRVPGKGVRSPTNSPERLKLYDSLLRQDQEFDNYAAQRDRSNVAASGVAARLLFQQ